MNKQDAQTIVSKLSKSCNIPEKNLVLKKQSKTKYEIQIGKNLQENEWLCLEEIVSDHTLRLKLHENLIVIY